MKKMKKMLAILLTLMMAMGMTTMFASAAGETIKIENAVPGQEYSAYILFEKDGATYYMTNDQYNIWGATVNEVVSGAVSASSPGGRHIVDATKLINPIDPIPVPTAPEYATYAAKVTALAQKLNEKLATLTPEQKNVLKTGNTLTATDVADNNVITVGKLGYFFVDSSLGSICALVHPGDEANVVEKNKEPIITKTSDEKSIVSAEVGKEVPFKIEVTTKASAETDYVVHDKMTNLELIADSIKVKVKVGEGEEDVAADNYTVTTSGLTDGCTFEIKINNNYIRTLADNTEITITYIAKVTDAAVTVHKNEAHLQYGNTSSVDKEVIVYTGTINVDKYKAGEESTKLSGAVFVIRKAAEGGSGYVYLKDATEGYEWVTSSDPYTDTNIKRITTDEKGKASVSGLDAGTYELLEVVAPEGYNLATEAFSVTLSLDGTGSKATMVQDKAIANRTGSLLPETGGIGTTLFYIFGSILVVGAGVVLVARRRMHAEK